MFPAIKIGGGRKKRAGRAYTGARPSATKRLLLQYSPGIQARRGSPGKGRGRDWQLRCCLLQARLSFLGEVSPGRRQTGLPSLGDGGVPAAERPGRRGRRGRIEAWCFFPSCPAQLLPPARLGGASGAWAGWANASVASSAQRRSSAGLGRLSGPLGEVSFPAGRLWAAPASRRTSLLCRHCSSANEAGRQTRGSLGTCGRGRHEERRLRRRKGLWEAMPLEEAKQVRPLRGSRAPRGDGRGSRWEPGTVPRKP